MNKRLNITINDIDYDIDVDWTTNEYPLVGDFLDISNFYSDKDRVLLENKHFMKFIEDEGFRTPFEYMQYYRWVITERCWSSSNMLSIYCEKYDPLL